MKITDIRRHNLQLLQDSDFGGVQARMAARLRRKPAQISQWFAGYRTIREDTARDLELKAGKPPGWLDVDRSAAGELASAGLRSAQDSAKPTRVLQPRTATAWPLTVLSAEDWRTLTDDERMQLEAALLAAYADVKRRRRQTEEAEAAAVRSKQALAG